MKEFPDIEKFLPKDSLDYQRLLSFQEKAKANGYAKGHLWLASLAAFPAFLTPDLLHKTWLNFRHIAYQNGQNLDIDRMAVSDLLLSSLVEEIAVEVFKIRAPIRTALLALLKNWSSFVKDGDNLLKKLADFNLRYVRSYQMEGESVTTAIREAQEWNALAYFNPNAAAMELKKALSGAVAAQAKQKVLRISLLLSEMDDQFTRLGQKSQQEQFRTLVNYGQGMRALIRGQQEEAVRAFRNIERQVIQPEGSSTTGQRVQLPIPKEIYQAIAVERKEGSSEETGQIFALLVGIAQYEQTEEIPLLEGVESDLTYWQDFFSTQIAEDVQINTLRNGAATKAAVLEAIKLECRKASAGSQVFFFFSGFGENQAHGREETVLLLYDYQTDSEVGTLSEREFRAQVEAFLPKGAGITLFLDTHSGGDNWLDTSQSGRFIYNATDIHEGAQESPAGGLLTRAFQQAVADVGGAMFTHLGLMGHLRSLMPALSNGMQQTATWYGRRDEQETSFLGLPAPADLRLRELMVDTGLAPSIHNIDVPAVLSKFQADYAIGGNLSAEKALSLWATTQQKSFKVFISQSGPNLALGPYLENYLFDQNIPHELFTYDLQRELEQQMQKFTPIPSKDWTVHLSEANFILLQLDEGWVTNPVSAKVVHQIELRLMEAPIPYALVYTETCEWTSHPVSKLGTPWPTASIAEVYAQKEEQAFVADLSQHLTPVFDYIACFLGTPSSELGLEQLHKQLIESILENLGRFHPAEVARISREKRAQTEQLTFIQEHYPTPLGQLLAYLLAPRVNSERLAACFQAWLMLVHTLNTFLVALVRQLILRREDGLKEQLQQSGILEQLKIQDGLSQAATTTQLLEIVQSAEQLPGLLEELGLSAEAWRQLAKRELPGPVADHIPLTLAGEDKIRATQAALSNNYGQLIQWFLRLEIFIDLKWENLCQLYSNRGYSPLLYHEQGLNPFAEKADFYRFIHQEDTDGQLYFRSLGGTIIPVDQETEETAQIWESFQQLLDVLGVEKAIPSHPEQVHALLVGIRIYPTSFLRAPEQDIQRFEAYLKEQPLPAQSQVLDGPVTKAQVLESLRQLVEKASPGDAVIFYFSGLGQKEQSPNSNDTIPALLTYDQQRIPIDEIVYLLCHDKPKALHPIIILDMGTNAQLSEENIAAGWKAKGVDPIAPQRDWENYGFGEEIRNMQDWASFMNAASFVLMVGCDYEHETALEDERHSFFTRNLIEVLSRSRHFLPYSVLQERLTEVLSHQVPQTPDIRIEGPPNQLSSRNFLGQASPDFQPLYGRIEWNRSLQSWIIDMGTKWGISNRQIIHLSTEDYKGNRLGRISYVSTDYSVLAFGDQLPDRSQIYWGFVDDFLQTEPLRLAIAGYGEEMNRAYMMELGGTFPGLEFEEGKEADFRLEALEDGFVIRSAQFKEGYIHRVVEQELAPPFTRIRGIINKLAQAKALASLSSIDITQDPFAEDLPIELFQIDEDGQSHLLSPTDTAGVVESHYQLDFEHLRRFQIQVKNQTKARRYLSILLIRTDLGISNLLSTNIAHSLGAGETLESQTWRTVLPVVQEREGKASFHHTVKILASDQPFAPAYWLQSGLNITSQEKEAASEVVDDTTLLAHDNLWSISTLRIDNSPNEISLERLQQWLKEGQISKLLAELVYLLPAQSTSFQQLISMGSRYFELQRLLQNGQVNEKSSGPQQERIKRSLASILDSRELADSLAKEAPSSDLSTARQRWYGILLKDGIKPALEMLPALSSLDKQAQEQNQQWLKAAYEQTTSFASLQIDLENYLVEYNRLIQAILSSLSEQAFSDQGAKTSKEVAPSDLPIPDWEDRKKAIKAKLAMHNILEALEEFRQTFPKHQITQNILLWQASYNLTIRERDSMLLSDEQAKLYTNQTIMAILDGLAQIDKLGVSEVDTDWESKRHKALLVSFLKGDLRQSIADLAEGLANQKDLQEAAIILQHEFEEVQKSRLRGTISEQDYRQAWSKVAVQFLDRMAQLENNSTPSPDTPPAPPSRLDPTLTLDRKAQFDALVSTLKEQTEGLQIFFLLAPPKSAPLHFIERISKWIKPTTDSPALVLDPIPLAATSPLHRLSSELEEAWESQLQIAQLDKADSVMTTIHFQGDWFEHKEDLAAWLASEGEKRVKERIAPQLIALVILELPKERPRTPISRLFRGDPSIKERFRWLEKATEPFPNAHLLPILNRVSQDDIKDWLQSRSYGENLTLTGSDRQALRKLLVEGQLREVIELLQKDSSLSEEDQGLFLAIRQDFNELERSKSLGILTTNEILVRQARTMKNLLSLLSELENKPGVDQSARAQKEVFDRLQAQLGNPEDGYHMEDVLRVIPFPSKGS